MSAWRGLGRGTRDVAQRLAAQLVEQQAGADIGVVRLGLDEGAGGQYGASDISSDGDAVIEVAQRLGQHRIDAHPFKAGARLRDKRA